MSISSQPAKKSLQPCDLVLKGGITSGIVYPPAILQLKDDYQFCNIGGTSAGAIAAAGVASAEFQRRTSGGDAGFTYLNEHVQQWLSRDGNLRNLFQASPATKPLMDLAFALLPTPSHAARNESASESRRPRKTTPLQSILTLLGSWLVNYPPVSLGAVLGAIIGIILVASIPLAILALLFMISPTGAAQSMSGFTIAAVILGIVSAWLGWHIGGVISAITSLQANYYGICTGHGNRPDGTPDCTNLTAWLSKVYDEMAGNDHPIPLTFGHLKDKGVALKMVTSNLSHCLPYVMPGGLHNFLFKKNELLKFFPQYIVEHMIKHQPNPQDPEPEKRPLIPLDRLPVPSDGDEYYYLPDADDLPVVVGTRMSLSFPILLSAVPLYSISTRTYRDFKEGKSLEQRHLQRNWFSDGGICSNFPLQFFDAWLPKWPTFGINLTKFSSTNATSALQAYDKPVLSAAITARESSYEPVFLPGAEDSQDPDWNNVNGLISFAQAAFGTAQSYRDSLQANLPSYRERIVQIRLNKDEGGLNLAMPKKTIERVVEKGREAGAILHDEFNFEQHVWVRFLVLMAQLEDNLTGMQDVLKGGIKSQPGYPYTKSPAWIKDAVPRVEALLQVIRAWDIPPLDGEQEPDFFSKDAPLPKPVLRVTPEM